MASSSVTVSEMDALAYQLMNILNLESADKGAPQSMERLAYTANPFQLEYLRQQVLKEQNGWNFDDNVAVKRCLEAAYSTAQKGDSSYDDYVLQNQMMIAACVDSPESMPGDLANNWMCMVCPQGDRVLVVAAHKTTHVYSVDGRWLCEHNTHLPGGSPSPVSNVDDPSECTILDCLYNDEQEAYHVLDILCWKGVRYYKSQTHIRLNAVLEKTKGIPTLKNVTQTNPFRFYTLPVSYVCHLNAICSTIGRAKFEIAGLLFYHKKALYLPGLTPLGVWLMVDYIPSVLDIWVWHQEYSPIEGWSGRRDYKRNRYVMTPEQSVCFQNAAFASSDPRNYSAAMGPSSGWVCYPYYNKYGYEYEDYSYGYPDYSYGQDNYRGPGYQLGGYHLKQKKGKGQKKPTSDAGEDGNTTSPEKSESSPEKMGTSVNSSLTEQDTSGATNSSDLSTDSGKSDTATKENGTEKSDTSLDNTTKSDTSLEEEVKSDAVTASEENAESAAADSPKEPVKSEPAKVSPVKSSRKKSAKSPKGKKK